MRSGEHEHSFDCFGTRVRLLVGTRPAAPVDAELSALRVQARLERLHRALTRFDPASELSRLNAHAGEHVHASPTMAAAIASALAAALRTQRLGRSDDPARPRVRGYATSRAGAPPADLAHALAAAPPRRLAQPRPAAEWREIELDPQRRTVRIPASVRLDLGGTAKGLAVDATVAARMLATQPTFAADAGGDIQLGGTDTGRRTVRIEHPLDDTTVQEIELASAPSRPAACAPVSPAGRWPATK